jgi:hypothetical protein
MHKEFQVKNHKGRDHTENLGKPGRIKLILKNKLWGCGLGSTGSEQGSIMASCNHGYESSRSIKRGIFLYQMSTSNFPR